MKTFSQFMMEAVPLAAIVKASSYGPGLYGNPTASGQILTPKTSGVAHKKLPLGTPVKIADPKTGRSVTTKVIDRGPYHGDREYDITDKTVRDLGYKGGWKEFGVRKVDITPVTTKSTSIKPPKVTKSKGLMYGKY